jgi:ribonucleoside-diphosphate reductase beta chain
MAHQQFASTTRGIQRDHPAMRLFEKAKRLGIWNPSEIDFAQDRQDWLAMSPAEQDLILRLTAQFQAGEEAVTLDLLPLIMTIAREGRLEEEMFLTTFLWEEAKHADFFSRFLSEVVRAEPDLSRYHTPSYRAIFYEALPAALNHLLEDPSPAAQAVASLTYNMIVEGVLAETGYHAYFTILESNNLMPGQRQGIRLLKQDESRHIAYGVFLLSRLIAADDSLWEIVETQMNDLVVHAIGITSETFAAYDVMPFGVVEDDFINYALDQFGKRLTRIEQARGKSLDEIYRTTVGVVERDDG